MSRPRTASVEAKVRMSLLEKQVSELQDFKERIELGQRWLVCALFFIGGVAAFAASVTTFLSYFKPAH